MKSNEFETEYANRFPENYERINPDVNLLHRGQCIQNKNIPKCLNNITVTYDSTHVAAIDLLIILLPVAGMLSIAVWSFTQILAFVYIAVALFILGALYLIVRFSLKSILKSFNKDTEEKRQVSMQCCDGKVVLSFTDGDGSEKSITYTDFTYSYEPKFLAMTTKDKNIKYLYRAAMFDKNICDIDEIYNFIVSNGVFVYRNDTNTDNYNRHYNGFQNRNTNTNNDYN